MEPSTPPPTSVLPPWLRVVLPLLGLLLVPLAAWLLVPEPGPPRRAASLPTREAMAPETDEDEPLDDEPPPAAPRDEPAPTPSPTAEELRGMVTSGERVVPGAGVTCRRADGELFTATTEPNGQFGLPPEADGCTATARSPSYGNSEPVELRLGGENRIDLPQQGGISGVVVDERGLPLDGFLVSIEHATLADGSRASGGMQRRFSDPEGKFAVDRLGVGRWTLVVSAAGRPGTKIEVAVEAGKTTEDVRVRLERGATLVGSVIDRQTKRGIGGAEVSLDTGPGQSAIEPVTTSPGGDFRLEGVPAGAFGIEVRHPDYLARIVSGLDTRGQRQLRTTVDLAPASDGGGRLEMSGIGASLSGDAEGQVRVTGVRGDGPAERAGMLADDVIAAIDGKSAQGLSVQECVQLLRGPTGTEVHVSVRRGGASVDMTIVRDVIVH